MDRDKPSEIDVDKTAQHRDVLRAAQTKVMQTLDARLSIAEAEIKGLQLLVGRLLQQLEKEHE